MADPPWDIHMSVSVHLSAIQKLHSWISQLPYGTMKDDEMKAMPIPALQDEGIIFLWVTGRAMEVGRECLREWGYTRVDEVVWVKTNQVRSQVSHTRTTELNVPIASTRYSNGTNRALAKPHQRTHARRCQERPRRTEDRNLGREMAFVVQQRAGRGRRRV